MEKPKKRDRAPYFREYRRKKRAERKAIAGAVGDQLAAAADRLELLKGEIIGAVVAHLEELLEGVEARIMERLAPGYMAPPAEPLPRIVVDPSKIGDFEAFTHERVTAPPIAHGPAAPEA